MVLIPTGQAGKICLGLAVIAMLESTLRANLTGILAVYRNQPVYQLLPLCIGVAETILTNCNLKSVWLGYHETFLKH
jgi:hypothetical protein